MVDCRGAGQPDRGQREHRCIGTMCQRVRWTLSGADEKPTRNVVLSDRQQDLVETLVQSGRYQHASEVLRDGLRLIEERERLEDAKLKALKQAARMGWTDRSAGRYTDVLVSGLEDFIGQLGRRAAPQTQAAN